jgi:hypothetical protein
MNRSLVGLTAIVVVGFVFWGLSHGQNRDRHRCGLMETSAGSQAITCVGEDTPRDSRPRYCDPTGSLGRVIIWRCRR